MDRDKLLAFYYTVTLGSTSKAANKLGVQPPAISKLLKGLEREVGHQLLSKKGRNLALNDKGKIFFETAQNILEQYDLSLEKMAKLTAGIEEKFIIDIHPLIKNPGFIKEIAPFLKDHPEVSFTFKTLSPCPNFKGEEIGIAIHDAATSSLEEERQVSKHLATFSRYLYASQDYLKKRGMPENIQDFTSHTLIYSEQERNASYNKSIGSLRGRRALIFDCPSDALQAIENGLGIGCLPSPIAQACQQPLIPILPEQWVQ
ncbi:LysR family transcriptional regulator, partial [Candidatus Odyssella thessalonicensis]|uniref:LysR family transcriptional regulator n=1 Tax=Candidatus Odyssella thessalonicensis TaxID=84647 RepID=UPI000225ACF8